MTAENNDRGWLDLDYYVAASAAGAGDDGAVDAEALNYALLAVQADAPVSRAGLHRMLSARQRRPLREDSSPVSLDEGGAVGGGDSGEGKGGDGGGDDDEGGGSRNSRPASPGPEGRHRRRMTMDDRWVRHGMA